MHDNDLLVPLNSYDCLVLQLLRSLALLFYQLLVLLIIYEQQ